MSKRTTNRYDAAGPVENQFEPGSRGRVLKNLPGIKSRREMEATEWEAFVAALERLTVSIDAGHRFVVKDILEMHRLWLGKIYPWAGRYRGLDLSKGGFRFASARFVPQLMSDFEKDVLRVHTPLGSGSLAEMAEHLAVVHVELVLIHPFRDGNGRIARLLSMCMGMQAKLPVLDFGAYAGHKREEYFSAVRAGMGRDCRPMVAIMEDVIARTLQSSNAPGDAPGPL